MKLLNSKPIVECDEKEELLHKDEVNKICNNIYKFTNIDCALVITDSENNEPKVMKCKLHDIFDYLENFDIKNGIDIYQDNDFLTFVLNGQTYKKENQIFIFNTFVKVLPLDAFGNVCKVYIENFI